MSLPIRAASEITVIINNAQAAVSGLGKQIVDEKKRGLNASNRAHRDKIYRLILLINYLQTLLDDNGNVRNWYSNNAATYNQMLDGVVKLSGIFQGPSIPLMTSVNIPIILYQGSSNSDIDNGGIGTAISKTVNSPSTIVDSFTAIGSYAFYVLGVSGVNAGEGSRTSTLFVTIRGSSTPTWTETKTTDLGGITTPIVFSFTNSGGNINLVATASTNNWSVNGFRLNG